MASLVNVLPYDSTIVVAASITRLSVCIRVPSKSKITQSTCVTSSETNDMSYDQNPPTRGDFCDMRFVTDSIEMLSFIHSFIHYCCCYFIWCCVVDLLGRNTGLARRLLIARRGSMTMPSCGIGYRVVLPTLTFVVLLLLSYCVDDEPCTHNNT